MPCWEGAFCHVQTPVFFYAVEEFSWLGYTRGSVSYTKNCKNGIFRQNERLKLIILWIFIEVTPNFQQDSLNVRIMLWLIEGISKTMAVSADMSCRLGTISCVAGCWSGLALFSGSRAAIDLVNKGLCEKCLCRTKALSKRWLEIRKEKLPVQG